MNFDHNQFSQALGDYTGIEIQDADNNYGWNGWNLQTDTYSQVLNYSKGGFNYRTWYQEFSYSGTLGMFVSCKVDYERLTGDDHIIILAGFANTNQGTTLVFAQASVEFHGSDNDNNDFLNIITPPITLDQYSDIGQGIYDAINSQLSANYGLIDGTNDGRQTLPDIARANVNSIKSASS